MPDAFTLANARIAVALNHSLNAHPALFKFVLFLTEQGTHLLMLLTLAALWFRPESLRQPASSPKSTPQKGRTFPIDAAQSRLQNRARILTFVFAAMLACIVARLLAGRFEIERPFATFLPIVGPPGVFNGLPIYGSLPGEYAALLGAIAAALFWWSARLGWAWTALALVLASARVAAGLNYPFDMAAGALLGVALVSVALRRQEQEGTFRNATIKLASGFESKNTFYQYLFYGLALLLLLDFSMGFRNAIDTIQLMRGEVSSGRF